MNVGIDYLTTLMCLIYSLLLFRWPFFVLQVLKSIIDRTKAPRQGRNYIDDTNSYSCFTIMTIFYVTLSSSK